MLWSTLLLTLASAPLAGASSLPVTSSPIPAPPITAPPITAPPFTAPPFTAPPFNAAELPDLKGAADRSIRWLRSTQDAKTGAYGGGVEGTSWVLLALAVSPRHYQRSDGPFIATAIDYLLANVREDGAIAAADATGDARVAQTKIAARALNALGDPSSSAALAGALKFLAQHGVDNPGDATERDWATELSAAERRSNQLLAKADERGAWDGEGGKVLVTARTVVELSHYYARWRTKSTPGDAKPLPEFDSSGFARGDWSAVDAAVDRGVRYLLRNSDNGRFGAPGEPDAGMTAMALGALATWPEPRPEGVQQALEAGWAWLVSLQHEDGSIHDGKLASYITSASILALARSGRPEHEAVILKARDFLVALQADAGEGYSSDHHYYGGIGYGGDERPDLSNLQMALEALAVSGLESDHEAYSRALVFLQRCQNRSESNDLELVDKGTTYVSGDDGGSAYMPGNSPAGYVELSDGRKVARSYGSMSYALLKGYIFAGLERDDPRVEALWKWLQENYTLDINPGFEFSSDRTAAYQGLFYYFHTMAKALDLFGAETLVDRGGREHHWRRELCARLVAMQSKTDGSWINQNSPRWWEGNPVLATSYVLLTLESAKP